MKIFRRGLYLLVALLVPVILVLATIRIMLTPIYIQIEYRLPGFPEDSYGFNLEDRLFWANISRLYLVKGKDIEYLANKQLDDTTPLYNARELQHMEDVQIVIRGAMIVLYLSTVYLLGLGIWSKKTRRLDDFRTSISNGGWITVGIIVLVLSYLGLNFNSLFTNFHRIFFEGDTWLFKYSDTLIRLFPIRFWRDAFIWIGASTLLAGGLLGRYMPVRRNS